MYCYHCGKEINENKIEAKASSFAVNETISENTTVSYVCPRCGHLITKDATPEQIKSLSRASHSELQRGSNHFAFGMGFFAIGIILLTIAIIFFVLAHKPNNGFQLVTACAEFYVSIVLFAVSAFLLIFGGSFAVKGMLTRMKYHRLLKDINNETFIQ